MTYQLPIELLPGTLRELAEQCGSDVALRLLGEYGGCHVVVPREIHPDHPIALRLGLQAARAICRTYGGEILTIPKGDSARRHIRNESNRHHRRAGSSLRDLARQFNLTERQVCTITRPLRTG